MPDIIPIGKAINNVKKTKLTMPTKAVYIPDLEKCRDGRLVKKDQSILPKPFDKMSINKTASTTKPIPVHSIAKYLNVKSFSFAVLNFLFLFILLPEFLNNPITYIIQNKGEYKQH